MKGTGAKARQGLIMGLAGIEAAVTVGAATIRHAGWWLDWHTRTHPGGGCQAAAPAEQVRATLRLVRVA